MTTSKTERPEKSTAKKPANVAPAKVSQQPESASAAGNGFSEGLGNLFRGLGLFIASLWKQFFGVIGKVLKQGYDFVESWLLDGKKSLYGLAMTRIVLGITGFGLLFFNFNTRLYSFGAGAAWNLEAMVAKSDFPKIWIFSLFHDVMLNDSVYTLCYLLLMAVAVLFTIGWRFKFVLPVYFVLWVSFIEANDMLGDQGDNMYRIALIFLFFADPAARISLDWRRRRKYQAKPETAWIVRKWKGEPLFDAQIGSLFHNLALVVLTAQVCFVYVSGALYKAGGKPWQNGWAIYSPLSTDRFGTWPALSDLFTFWGPVVVAISWGSIIIQMCFPLMLLTRPTRIVALLAIMSFHVGIAVLMGLPWFSLTMIAIDFIFIRDRTWKSIGARIRDSFRKSMLRARSKEPLEGEADEVGNADEASVDTATEPNAEKPTAEKATAPKAAKDKPKVTVQDASS
ncbi:HTTM domain-containing protein [Psychromicrobium lacuslunae]|uniref:HTTM domain-containing protein n=1 Tax=Psychromicrobium lacuslunae TaxID=1618207 RepID=UPI0009E24495|nr:HTTM domain-containing protein [Psychromicrobium lacuslunae]